MLFNTMPAPLLAALPPAPWPTVGLVMAILITLIPLTAVLAIYFKLAKRSPHKPIELLPLAEKSPRALSNQRASRLLEDK